MANVTSKWWWLTSHHHVPNNVTILWSHKHMAKANNFNIEVTSRWSRSLGKWRHLRNDCQLTQWLSLLRSDDQMVEALIHSIVLSSALSSKLIKSVCCWPIKYLIHLPVKLYQEWTLICLTYVSFGYVVLEVEEVDSLQRIQGSGKSSSRVHLPWQEATSEKEEKKIPEFWCLG